MAVPKRRTSRSKSRKRRSQQHLRGPDLVYCKQCETAVPPHQVCPECGNYQGRAMIKVEEE